MVSRATQGLFPPASTFKVVSLPAAVQSGYDLHGSYQCGSSYQVGERAFHNYESEAYGTIDLHKAIVVSCDTIFYKFAYETWLRLGGSDNHSDAKDPFVAMAKAFGLGKDDRHRPAGRRRPAGSRTGPGSRRTGRAPRSYYCGKAKTGFPEVAKDDPSRARVPDPAGQGELRRRQRVPRRRRGELRDRPGRRRRSRRCRWCGSTRRIANGGTLWTPHLGKAIVTPAGKLVQRIAPKKAGTVPLRPDVLTFLHSALRGVVTSGTAPRRVRRVPGAGGRQDRHRRGLRQAGDVLVLLVRAVQQPAVRGLGRGQPGRHGRHARRRRSCGTSTRRSSGCRATRSCRSKAALPGGKPPAALPTIRPDGTIVTPEGPVASTQGLPDPRAKATAVSALRLDSTPARAGPASTAASGCGWTGGCWSPRSALSLIGALLVWSATRRVEGDALLIRHLVNLGIGMLLGGAVALVDYRGLRAYSPVLYVAVDRRAGGGALPAGLDDQRLALLDRAAGRASPCSRRSSPRSRWSSRCPLLLAEKRDADDTPRHVDVALALVVAAIPMALVMLQPDLGLGAGAGRAAWSASSRPPARRPAGWSGLLVVGAVGIAVGLGTNVLDTYQKDRLTAFADPTVDPRGIGYQTRQVRIAIG